MPKVSGYGGSSAAVNNGILDPFQGYDADVFALDQSTGKLNLVGRFASIRLTVRNNIEQYIEFNQRIERNLDGILQFGWVLERGMLDTRAFQQTFGYSKMTRTDRINRQTRLQISFLINAPELSGTSNNIDSSRDVSGEYVLTYCVPVEWSIDAVAGKSVIANRWQGLAEGFESVTRGDSDAILNPGTSLSNPSGSVSIKDRPTPFPWDVSASV